GQLLFCQRYRHRVIVRLAAAATQYDMTVLVATGGGQGDAAVVVDTETTVRMLDAEHGIDCHFQAAVGTVLEADRAGQAGWPGAVRVRFAGARANRGPGDQVLQVLRRERVERLGRRRQAQLGHVEQRLAGDVQAVLDLERVVHVRIV